MKKQTTVTVKNGDVHEKIAGFLAVYSRPVLEVRARQQPTDPRWRLYLDMLDNAQVETAESAPVKQNGLFE